MLRQDRRRDNFRFQEVEVVFDLEQLRQQRMGTLHRQRARGAEIYSFEFVSAMTLLQRMDGDHDASYLELVELPQARGARTQSDSEELFRQVVFSICISNTDDHLRNHGFFVEETGLVLSPAFDVNPNPHKDYLCLAIDEVGHAGD